MILVSLGWPARLVATAAADCLTVSLVSLVGITAGVSQRPCRKTVNRWPKIGAALIRIKAWPPSPRYGLVGGPRTLCPRTCPGPRRQDSRAVGDSCCKDIGRRQRGCVCRSHLRFRAVALAAVFARRGACGYHRANSLPVRWKNAYSAGQKTARAPAATEQFSRTNPSPLHDCHPLRSRSASGVLILTLRNLIAQAGRVNFLILMDTINDVYSHGRLLI